MKPKLSLVVPVYNVAPFLAQCLDSLLGQTVRVDEIVVVDDGSTDGCAEILDGYAASHPQIRLIRQANGGLSVARNAGLEQARGEYVAFVDSDDFVAPEMYERLLAMAERDRLDMALANAWYHFDGREADYPIYRDAEPMQAQPGAEWLRRRLAKKHFLHMVWLHLYRRSFIEELGLRFDPGFIHEDVVWTTRALLAARRVSYDPAPLYYYRIRIRHFEPEANDRRLQAIIASSVHNAQALDKVAAGAAQDRELQRLIRWQLVDGALSIFHKLAKFSGVELRRRQCRQLLRSGLFGQLWRNAVSFSQRRRIARNYLKCLMAGKD